MRRRVSDHSAELSRHAWASARPTCATVWELTAYTNGRACFSRVVLVVSYISPHAGWVSPTVSYHLPNYPPR